METLWTLRTLCNASKQIYIILHCVIKRIVRYSQDGISSISKFDYLHALLIRRPLRLGSTRLTAGNKSIIYIYIYDTIFGFRYASSSFQTNIKSLHGFIWFCSFCNFYVIHFNISRSGNLLVMKRSTNWEWKWVIDTPVNSFTDNHRPLFVSHQFDPTWSW